MDFRLPPDIKRDARTTDGTAFVGFNFVHGHDNMRLDVQSIANLHPFIDAEDMLTHLEQEGALFREAVETGKKAEAMARLERATTEDLEAWPLRSFFARGGEASWFPGMVKELVNGHIQRLEVGLERGKLRVPYSGGRYYVMTGDVATAAGMDIQVEPGQVHLDPKTGTAWVNSGDWLRLPDSPDQGIKHILGGADQDDALWVHGFTDHDGAAQGAGLAQPEQHRRVRDAATDRGSQPMLWHTPDGETVMYPPADSRKLPPRIDHASGTEYLHLAQEPAPGELGQGQAYHPDLMKEVNARTQENAGILGSYCNFTLGYKGTVGTTPPVLPDHLENVIDNDVKLGGSNALVGEKINELTLDFLRSGTPIPKFLLSRFGVYPDPNTGEIPARKKFTIGKGDEQRTVWAEVRTTDGAHWVDRLADGVRDYTDRTIAYRDEQMAAARLPAAVSDSVAQDPDAVTLGARFNGLYTRSLREARKQYASVVQTRPQENRRQHEAERKRYNTLVLDYVRAKSEAFLDEHPAERHTAILRGAMVSRELNATDPTKTSSDSAFWQRGRVAETSIRALTELGLLGEIHEQTSERGTRLVRYPTPTESARQATYEPVKMSQVWFNREIAGRAEPPRMKDIPKATQKQRKAEVRTLATRSHEQGGFVGQRLTVEERYFGTGASASLVFEDERGDVFGVIPRAQRDNWFVGEQVVVRAAKGSDGNLNAMVERLNEMNDDNL